jgi:XapX domain-containing protein
MQLKLFIFKKCKDKLCEKHKGVLSMKEVLLALLTGLIVGFIFALCKLPIPAPPALAGIVGIVGIYLGFKVFEWIF